MNEASRGIEEAVLVHARELGYGGRVHFCKMEVYAILGAYFHCSVTTARRYWSKAVGEVAQQMGRTSNIRNGFWRVHVEDLVLLIEAIEG